MNKVCKFCKKEKSANEFYRDLANPDGLKNLCKSCSATHRKAMEMGMKRARKVVLDKEKLDYLVKNWEKITFQDIAQEWRCSVEQVNSIVQNLRGLGIPLAKKWKSSPNRQIMREFAEEWLKNHGKKPS